MSPNNNNNSIMNNISPNRNQGEDFENSIRLGNQSSFIIGQHTLKRSGPIKV